MISAPKEVWGVNVFAAFVDELGMAQTCNILGVPEAKVRRWLRNTGVRDLDPVPRMAVLALYWETKFGRSMIDTAQVNEIRLLYQRIHLLEDQFAKARDIVIGLRKLHTGTANEAYFDDLQEIERFKLDTYGVSRSVAEEQQLRAHAG
ncbi:MAG: hypothetical protein NTZ15_18680 [Burkholderiales bacterium]|nr:hypothetical protein [Burkholderiales bacterium]